MTGPILIYCREADTVAAHVSGRFPKADLRPVTSAEALATAAPDCSVGMVINNSELSRDSFRQVMGMPSLRWLHVGGSGYDHIGAWDPTRVQVTNSAGVLAPFLAETCFGAMLTINHNLLGYRDQQRAEVWASLPFRPLLGQTVLIVGMGEIGRRFAHLCKAAGMRVIGLRRRQDPMVEADEIRPPDALDDSLAEADIVSVHLRLTEDTRHSFNAARFAAMKDGAIFMNTGRGGLVDEAALLKAADRLKGIYLDVFETEPLPAHSPLWSHPKVFMTPHASDGTEDWVIRFADFFADNLGRWETGTPLVNVVRPG